MTNKLTPRESEVFGLWLANLDLSQKELSASIGQSPKTIHTLLTSVRHKTGSRNLQALVLWASRNGLIGAPEAPAPVARQIVGEDGSVLLNIHRGDLDMELRLAPDATVDSVMFSIRKNVLTSSTLAAAA